MNKDFGKETVICPECDKKISENKLPDYLGGGYGVVICQECECSFSVSYDADVVFKYEIRDIQKHGKVWNKKHDYPYVDRHSGCLFPEWEGKEVWSGNMQA